jgi:MSHA biogenesis protein MshP
MTRSPEKIVRALRFGAGVGLVTAIFLMVVLAALGTAVVTIFSSQQVASALDVQGARAYQAARAGLEWGMFQALRNNSCAAQTAVALPGGTSISGFTVTVRCVQTGATDDPLVRYVLTSDACWHPGGDGTCPNATNSTDYVARRLEVEL